MIRIFKFQLLQNVVVFVVVVSIQQSESMFAKIFGGGFNFPYTVQDPYQHSWGNWVHYKGTSKDEAGAPLSIFKVEFDKTDTRGLEIARNGVKRLRALRHPNIVAFKDTAEQEERTKINIFIVTEPVSPLQEVLSEIELREIERQEYLAMGFRHIASAVSFLNNDARLIHGNLCVSTVLVTPTLDWKLGFLDLVSEHNAGAPGLQQGQFMVQKFYSPGEVSKGDWSSVPKGAPWAIDAWGLGCLMQEVFSGQPMTSVEQLRNTNPIPQALLSDYQKLLGSNPNKRLNPAKLVDSEFLKNQLVELVAFFENLAVKDSVERDHFFRKLPSKLPTVPVPVAQKKILPMLASALEFGSAPAAALGSLLEIGKQLPEDEFQEKVVPAISKLFASNDRSIRRSLLESITIFGPYLTEKVVEEQIYPNMQNGFQETNAYLRELTLKAMLTLAPKMSQKTLNQSLLKHLAKLQVDEEPSLRANTTVLLGNIAQYLGEASCKRILINAFSRALKDNFPASRIAALKALVATQQYHSAEDLAKRVLPAVMPLTIDPIQDARKAALSAADAFLLTLKKHSAQMEKQQQSDGSVAMGDTSQEATDKSSSGGYLGWAMSSLVSSKKGATPNQQPSSPTSAVSSPTPVTHPPLPSQSPAQPTNPVVMQRERTADMPLSQHEEYKDIEEDNGWGDDDDFAVDEEEMAARSRLLKPKQQSLLSQGQSQQQQRQSSFDDANDGWDEDLDMNEGWDDMDNLTNANKKVDPVAEQILSEEFSGMRPRTSQPAVSSKKSLKLGATRLGKAD
eukprot:TRINITY_DN4855_c0_g2_i1.p1 TRINITY_DN4855_c0_g2~~TRINITY_DN4855_c0_g2_i1.p1  ORF type:complete len:807 (+),score=106.86 TRINITY_DN4855_c0_g2_i1:50-2422(+)